MDREVSSSGMRGSAESARPWNTGEAIHAGDANKAAENHAPEMTTEDHAHSHRPPADAPPEPTEPTRRINPLRISTVGGPSRTDPCDVVVEEVLTIMIEGVGNLAVMCTPNDTVALAVGFLFAEGIITDIDDIVRLTQRADPRSVAVRVDGAEQAVGGRSLIVTSSCGMCGSKNIEALMDSSKRSGDTLRVSPSVLRSVSQRMRRRQGLFAQTGGTHAAAIFSADGEIITMGEDIGRHNALDKAVGKSMLEGTCIRGCGVMLSGRVSLEMLAKAAQAKLEIVAAVSAPTSMAIEMAQRRNITLCGFVRADRATVYTHPHRLEGIEHDNERVEQDPD